jgi:hypothetical protein
MSALLSQVDTVRLELGVWKRGYDEDIRDVGLVVDAVERHHDGVIPPNEPERDSTLHGWKEKHLE